jgi:hypothetical protein
MTTKHPRKPFMPVKDYATNIYISVQAVYKMIKTEGFIQGR